MICPAGACTRRTSIVFVCGVGAAALTGETSPSAGPAYDAFVGLLQAQSDLVCPEATRGEGS